MADKSNASSRWLDLLWVLFLVGLAFLPPNNEPHKLIILAIIGVFQLLERRVIQAAPIRGRYYVVLIKLGLATILINHTQDVAINSSYYPIFYLPVMTAAMYFGPMGTLLWTSLASAAYCSYLFPVQAVGVPRWLARLMGSGSESAVFTINAAGISELAMRMLFFFLVGMIVNRFVMEYRNQVRRYQELTETLSETNRSLKQAQAEARRAERLAALGQLSAGLAHEIRNPLGVIKGSAEILMQKLAASEVLAKELAGYIYTEVNRLSALVSRFLDFARPSRLALEARDLTAVLEKAVKAVADQGATTNVVIERDYAPGLPQVMIDEELCEQVFTNLVLNACQAMGEPGGTLRIRLKPENQLRTTVIAEIEDTGPGIAPDMKEQIFNPFVTTKKSGVGLGLAIVSKIVDAHGGSVQVVSTPGHPGACFRVSLPASRERGAESSSS
jgi:two-component system, NtrC family, sensor histidine kinase HydH